MDSRLADPAAEPELSCGSSFRCLTATSRREDAMSDPGTSSDMSAFGSRVAVVTSVPHVFFGLRLNAPGGWGCCGKGNAKSRPLDQGFSHHG